MLLTTQVQIYPSDAQARLLVETMQRYNAASNWLAAEAHAARIFKRIPMNRAFYRQMRDQFNIGARATVLLGSRVAGVFRRDSAAIPRFRPNAAIPFDTGTLTFKSGETVSVLSVAGRIRIPYKTQAGVRLGRDFKGSKLLRRRDGFWFLQMTYDVAEAPTCAVDGFVGVDMGVVNIATTSDGESYTAVKTETVRVRHADRRRRLFREATRQKRKGRRPKNVRRALARRWRHESLFRRDLNHCISKHLVGTAKGTNRGIAVEDLRHIRARIRFRREQRARMGGWAFAQLQDFIAYKAKLVGIPVVTVNAAYTSQTCSVCGHCERENRQTQASFVCVSCGHTANADVNAAQNIAARAAAVPPMVSEPPQKIAA